MDQALSLVQRYHLSLQSMQTWLDSAAAVLQRANSGVELENQRDCARELEEISAREKNFTAGLEELSTLDLLLQKFIDAGAMSDLREKVDAMQLRKTKVEQQLDAYREVLQRCVLTYVYTADMCSPYGACFNNKLNGNLFFLSCAALWISFQHEKETLVEQMNDAESKMAMFTTAKAVSVQQAEEKCQRYKVGHWLKLIKQKKKMYMCFVPHGCYIKFQRLVLSWQQIHINIKQ